MVAAKKETNKWTWVAIVVGVLSIIGWLSSNLFYPVMEGKFASKTEMVELGTRTTKVETEVDGLKANQAVMITDLKEILTRLPKP